jgi:NitT/TauT family transport system ATP-binding protein
MTNSAETLINFSHMSFVYPGGATIFQEFSWQVRRGETWAIIGPSGCGKSTLLYLIAGLRRPSGGRLLVDNQPISRPRPQTGLILQDYGLLPWATVWDNAALGLDIRRFYGPDGKHTPPDESFNDRQERVDYWLERLGIRHVARHYPNKISGGQRQRAAIARTLVLNPDLLLMDEPFGALDEIVRDHLNSELLKLFARTKKTIAFVTHSIPEAVYLSTKIVVMSPRPGRVTDIIQSTLPPGERPLDIRETPEFLEIAHRVREGLRAGHSYEEHA